MKRCIAACCQQINPAVAVNTTTVDINRYTYHNYLIRYTYIMLLLPAVLLKLLKLAEGLPQYRNSSFHQLRFSHNNYNLKQAFPWTYLLR